MGFFFAATQVSRQFVLRGQRVSSGTELGGTLHA